MDLVKNRKAFHDYEILEQYEAGVVLMGTEIKSLRNHGGHLNEAYVRIVGEEAWLIGASIAPYSHGSIHNHEERRDRKLLLHKREIFRLKASVKEKGMTLVPLALYLKKGKVKLKVGLGRGKKLFDKRHSIKEREEKRKMDRALGKR